MKGLLERLAGAAIVCLSLFPVCSLIWIYESIKAYIPYLTWYQCLGAFLTFFVLVIIALFFIREQIEDKEGKKDRRNLRVRFEYHSPLDDLLMEIARKRKEDGDSNYLEQAQIFMEDFIVKAANQAAYKELEEIKEKEKDSQ